MKQTKAKVYPNTDIDRLWFEGVMRDRGINASDIARYLGVHRAAISLLLSGKRRMSLEESYKLAALLAVPQPDVAKAAGIRQVESRATHVTIAGVVDERGRIKRSSERIRVARPAGSGEELVAVQFRTAGTELSLWDGWVAYALETTGLAPDAAGKLCLVRKKGERGKGSVAFVMKGYTPGRFNLVGVTKSANVNDVDLETARPVTWIRCA